MSTDAQLAFRLAKAVPRLTYAEAKNGVRAARTFRNIGLRLALREFPMLDFPMRQMARAIINLHQKKMGSDLTQLTRELDRLDRAHVPVYPTANMREVVNGVM